MKNIHWEYYLALENDLEKLSRYIEFDKENFNTYSIELAHLLIAASSESDVLLCEFCKIIEPGCKYKKFDKYGALIKNMYPSIISDGIMMPRYGLEFKPFDSWLNDENPEWWRSNNKVKHQRSDSFNRANLINALNSIAALFIVNIYYNNELISKQHPESLLDLRNTFPQLQPKSNLFRLNNMAMTLIGC